MLFSSFYSDETLTVIILATLPVVISLYFHSIKNNRLALWLLLFSTFLIRLAFASFDPFLHDWDERFHALVAKNMMEHPFRPMLHVDTVLPYDPAAWCCNHIWLHKQPLFLWQMALSMKLFGVNELAVRLPSVLLGTIGVYMIYDTTKLWVGKKDVAYLAAILLAFSQYHLELTSGRFCLEQNDVAFAFYVTASIWALVRYLNSEKCLKWSFLLGVFVGCAVLIKWLTGILVFGGWGLYLLLSKDFRFNIYRWLHLVFAVGVSVLVFLPWQLYIMNEFPIESAITFEHNRKHIYELVENHGGDAWFHLNAGYKHFGHLKWGVFLGILFFLFQKGKTFLLSLCFLSMVLVVYSFFSILVKTKMDGFTGPVHFMIWMFIALGVISILERINQKYKKWLFPLIVLISIFFSLRPLDSSAYRSIDNNFRNQKILKAKAFKNWNEKEVGENKIILNVNNFSNVELMFYKDVNAYQWYPDSSRLNSLILQGYEFAVLQHEDGGILPEYITTNPKTTIIEIQ